METFTKFIEDKIAPPLIKFSNLKYVQIIQRTFVASTGLLIVGSIFLLLASLPIEGYQNLIGDFSSKFAAVSGVGTSFIGIYVAITAAYALSNIIIKKVRKTIMLLLFY